MYTIKIKGKYSKMQANIGSYTKPIFAVKDLRKIRKLCTDMYSWIGLDRKEIDKWYT